MHKRGWVCVLAGVVAITLMAGPAQANAVTPVPLPYGSPAVITLPDWAALDATLNVTGGCFVTPLPARSDRTREVIVKATDAGQLCSVSIIDTDGVLIKGAQFTTGLGEQRAQLARPGGRMQVGSIRTLAPRDQRTLQGVPLTFAVTSDRRVCRVEKMRGSWVLVAKKPGRCSVTVGAEGIPARYAPYAKTLTFAVQPRR